MDFSRQKCRHFDQIRTRLMSPHVPQLPLEIMVELAIDLLRQRHSFEAWGGGKLPSGYMAV